MSGLNIIRTALVVIVGLIFLLGCYVILRVDAQGMPGNGLRRFRGHRTWPHSRQNAEAGKKFWSGDGKMEQLKLSSEGVERTYYVYRPACQVRYPAPVVMAFHGGGGTARGMDKLCGGITSCADRQGFVVVFPDGVSRGWNDGRTINEKNRPNDVQFISTLCDSIVKEGIADPQRIYATGISNGGFFSQYLALKLPDKIAAVASVAATLSDLHEGMMTHKPVPIMYILGVEDPLVPFSGGKIGGKVLWKSRGTAIPAERAVDFWLSNNGIAKNKRQEEVLDTIPEDGTKVMFRDYGQPGSRSQVSVYEIEGGGHTWPRGWQYLPVAVVGKTSQEMDANSVIWQFFNTHHL